MRDHQGALASFFARSGNDYARFNYLGEWHSHPSFDLAPSRTDIAAMSRLVEEPGMTFAVLMIVRLRMLRFLTVRAELFLADGSRCSVQVELSS